jgi:acetoin utilization deacetylase AcuC-like enzyme
MPGHPESPERVGSVADTLEKRGYTFHAPEPCHEVDIRRVHTESHMIRVKRGTFFDGDTPLLPNIFEYAKLSAGSAILSAQAASMTESAFSLMRPPGHHATTDRAMGFCYFNNIAIAIAHFLHQNPGKKAAILDIDVHHGNGTEDIFYENKAVFFVSLHQVPLYPGTGLESHKNILNIPLHPGTVEKDYLHHLQTACESIEDFGPHILGISAGFDTFQEDPLAQMNLQISTYGKIAERIALINSPKFIVLEGGYSQKMDECVYEFLKPFSD